MNQTSSSIVWHQHTHIKLHEYYNPKRIEKNLHHGCVFEKNRKNREKVQRAALHEWYYVIISQDVERLRKQKRMWISYCIAAMHHT
jgi:hypothetical protein